VTGHADGDRCWYPDYRRHPTTAAERAHVSVRVVPVGIVAHPGLHGAFVVLDFADEPSVVHIEGRRSGMFPKHPDEVDDYRLAVEMLTDLALDEHESQDLLRAEDSNCVEVAFGERVVGVRDSKDREGGQVTVGLAAFRALLAHLAGPRA
jgi:hypothetical protein